MAQMIDHTVYELASGRIVQRGLGIPAPGPGQGWVPGLYSPEEWVIVDGQPQPREGMPPEEAAALALAQERARMVCSPLQGRLTLGPDVCAAVDAMADDPATPWAMRQTIRWAVVWERTSPSMDQLAQVLGYSPAQMDDLFRAAMGVRV